MEEKPRNENKELRNKIKCLGEELYQIENKISELNEISKNIKTEISTLINKDFEGKKINIGNEDGYLSFLKNSYKINLAKIEEKDEALISLMLKHNLIKEHEKVIYNSFYLNSIGKYEKALLFNNKILEKKISYTANDETLKKDNFPDFDISDLIEKKILIQKEEQFRLYKKPPGRKSKRGRPKNN